MRGSIGSQLTADVRLPIDVLLYDRDVVLRTAYAYTDRAYIWLEAGEPGVLVVALARKHEGESIEALAGEFLNSLIDFSLRATIARETSAIRDAMFSAALGR